MIELPQLREPGRVSDIAGVKIYRTPWGVVNDEARIEILTYDHSTGASNITESGALGLNELLQIARDALWLAGKEAMARSLGKEIRQRRTWSQIAEKHLKEGTDGGKKAGN